MRIFAVSDLHIDYRENLAWLKNLSLQEYQEDCLILAGDISHKIALCVEGFSQLRKRFKEVLFVPGNHDLWVDSAQGKNSLEKLNFVEELAFDYGISMTPLNLEKLSIIPLYSWYDYSFGKPSAELLRSWSDYKLCHWPEGFDVVRVNRALLAKNEAFLHTRNEIIITFSHFLPRIDLMPFYIPPKHRSLFPVLGTYLLEQQIRQLGSAIHIYGHSHLNQQVSINHTLYINNAFGYPYERHITEKDLMCVYEA